MRETRGPLEGLVAAGAASPQMAALTSQEH